MFWPQCSSQKSSTTNHRRHKKQRPETRDNDGQLPAFPPGDCPVCTVRIAIISVQRIGTGGLLQNLGVRPFALRGHSESSPHFCWQLNPILPKYAAPQAVKAILSKRAKEQQSGDTGRTVQICSFVVSENRSNNSKFKVNSNK